MTPRRHFPVRLAPGGLVHLCDANAHTGGQTLCGQRWWFREPVWNPYADPYAEKPMVEPCTACQKKADEIMHEMDVPETEIGQ